MRCLAILAVILLSGCSLFSKGADDLHCPAVGFLSQADTMDLPAAKAAINGFTGTCRFKKPGEVIVDLTLPFAVRKNAAAETLKSVELPYFIAVLSSDDVILQRRAFSATVSFDNTETGSATEDHVVRIPASSPAEGYRYKIVIGFALTPEQLKHNRESK